MAETLPNLTYGTVTGRFLAAVADTVDDLDKNPDGVPLSGTVKFTPSVSALLLTSSNPPITVLPAAITATLDAEGYISLNGERGVNLIATDTMDTSPTAFTYEVSFQNIRYAGGANIPYPSFSIEVPADRLTDLTLTAPVPSSGGTPVVRDENAVWTAANTATTAAADAEAAAEDAHTVLAQMTDGTFSGVSLEVMTGATQALAKGDYNVIQFNTVRVDTLGGFDMATGLYTIPVSGTWAVSGSMRIQDSSLPAGSNVGVGIANQNGDTPGFQWSEPGPFRNTFQVNRSTFFSAGDKVRLYTYFEGTPDTINSIAATLSLNLITAAAVPGGGYVKPAGGIPYADLEVALQAAYDRSLALGTGGRLGKATPVVSNTDLNVLTDNGAYIGSNLINSPDGSNSFFYVRTTTFEAANWATQEAWSINGYSRYYRAKTSGTWQAWTKFDADKTWTDIQANTGAIKDGNRLGSTVTRITNADLNNYRASGWYGGYNLTNAPAGMGGAAFVEVIAMKNDDGQAADRVLQRATFYDGARWATYERMYNVGSDAAAGAWTGWLQTGDDYGARDGLARDALAFSKRLGPVSMNLGIGYDLDTLTENGWYNVQSPSGGPLGSAEWFFVQVQAYTNDAVAYRTQTATAFTGPASLVNRQWRRTKNAGAWSEWVEVGAGGGTAKVTKTAAYTLGGCSGQGNYGAMTMQVRVPIRLPKAATRMRVHVRNVVGLTDTSPSNGHSVSAVYIGQRSAVAGAPRMASQAMTAFPAGSGSLDNGGEFVTGWLAPAWNTEDAFANLTYTAVLANANVAQTYSAAGYIANTGTAGTELTGTPWQTYGATPFQVWIEYEYTDDGSKQVLFIGDSIVDGYYGGPFNQTVGPMRNWQGHIDSFPEAWSRHTRNVAITNAYASATINNWGTGSSKWTRFSTTAQPIVPDAIVIHLGINDWTAGQAYYDIITEMESWLRVVQAKYPGVRIYLMGVIPLTPDNNGEGALSFQDRVYLNMGYAAIDRSLISGYFEPDVLYDPATGSNENALAKYVSPDNLHFTPHGYETLARVIQLR